MIFLTDEVAVICIVFVRRGRVVIAGSLAGTTDLFSCLALLASLALSFAFFLLYHKITCIRL